MHHKITIKVVVDNNAADGFMAEHGFSVWIDNGSDQILLDCGQGDALVHNLSLFGKSVADVSKLVISHGHYDHTGAIDKVLKSSKLLTVYAHTDIYEKRYSIHDGKPAKDISIKSEQRHLLQQFPTANKRLTNSPVEVSGQVFATGEIPRNTSYEDTGGPFYLDECKETPDLIYDDQSIYINTKNGAVLITGCCHSGIVNTMDYVTRVFNQNIHMVIGGLHLVNATDERINKTIDAFRQFGVEKLIPCHCTGEYAISRMQQELGNMIQPGYAGMQIDL